MWRGNLLMTRPRDTTQQTGPCTYHRSTLGRLPSPRQHSVPCLHAHRDQDQGGNHGTARGPVGRQSSLLGLPLVPAHDKSLYRYSTGPSHTIHGSILTPACISRAIYDVEWGWAGLRL